MLAFRSVSIHCQYSGEYATQGSRFSSFTNNVRGEWDAGRSDTRSAATGGPGATHRIGMSNVANMISITGEEEGIAKSFLDPLASKNQLLVRGVHR